MPNPWLILAAIAALVGAYLVGNVRGHSAERAVWELALAKQKTEAANALAAATTKVRELEQAIDRFGNDVGVEHEKRLAEIDNLYERNRALTRRLRDPAGRGGGGDCTVGGDTTRASVPVGAEAGCELSDATTASLWAIARDADRDATIAASCIDYTNGLRNILNGAVK